MNLISIFYSRVIPVGLWIVMLGMGLSLTPRDIRNIFAMPKAVAIGITGQHVLLPLLAFALAVSLAPTPAIAVGTMILASCPGGITSNAYSFATRADVALSVTLTALSSFVTIFTLPLLTYFALNHFYGAQVSAQLSVPETIYTLATLTIIPVALGMLIRRIWSEQARRLIESVRALTFWFLMLLIVAGTVVSFDVLRKYFLQAALVAVALNVLAMSMAFGLGRLFRLSVPQSVSITYEVGIQNISLASLVILSVLHREDLVIVTLVYAVVMKITAVSFMLVARKWLVRTALLAPQPGHPDVVGA